MATPKVQYKSIYVNVLDKTFTPGKLTCKGNFEEYQPEFADYIAGLIQKDLVKAIETQSLSSKWKPLSPSYLAHKKKKGLSTKIWKATGNMEDSIYKINRKDKVLVGVTGARRYPGTNRTLLEVARDLEYGTSKVPSRPLFRPIVEKYTKNVSRYWRKFLKSKGLIKS